MISLEDIPSHDALFSIANLPSLRFQKILSCQLVAVLKWAIKLEWPWGFAWPRGIKAVTAMQPLKGEKLHFSALLTMLWQVRRCFNLRRVIPCWVLEWSGLRRLSMAKIDVCIFQVNLWIVTECKEIVACLKLSSRRLVFAWRLVYFFVEWARCHVVFCLKGDC